MNTERNKFSFNIAYCGVACALATVVMFGAIIPPMAYVMPAFAGIIVWSVCGQINYSSALLCYAATATLSLLLIPEIEAKTLFVLLFGYYPLLRERLHELTQQIKSKVRRIFVRFTAKFVLFNVMAIAFYYIVVGIFGVADVLNGFEEFGQYAVYAFWAMGAATFFLYDFALKYVYFAFNNWIKPAINKKIR